MLRLQGCSGPKPPNDPLSIAVPNYEMDTAVFESVSCKACCFIYRFSGLVQYLDCSTRDTQAAWGSDVTNVGLFKLSCRSCLRKGTWPMFRGIQYESGTKCNSLISTVPPMPTPKVIIMPFHTSSAYGFWLRCARVRVDTYENLEIMLGGCNSCQGPWKPCGGPGSKPPSPKSWRVLSLCDSFRAISWVLFTEKCQTYYWTEKIR